MTSDPQSPAGAREFLTASTAGQSKSDEDARSLAVSLAQLFEDDKCTGILVLDVRGISPITSFIVIASGTSERQMKSVLDHGVDLAEERGSGAFRVSSDTGAKWLVADFVDVVAHLFEPNTRAHYDLEMLWGDAERIDWRGARA